MKARAVLFVALGPGCSGYQDPTTGEEARYSLDTLRTRLDLEIGTVCATARSRG
jgi:hypothetical protein